MTDEREENSQKDEVETFILVWYIFLSNRTKLFFYRHLILCCHLIFDLLRIVFAPIRRRIASIKR